MIEYTYKIIDVERNESTKTTSYTLLRINKNHGGYFKFKINQHDNLGFTVTSAANKPIGYPTELRNHALDAIANYKMSLTLTNKGKEIKDLYDNL